MRGWMFGTSGSALPSVFLSSVSSLLVPLCLLHPPLSVYLLHVLLSSLSLSCPLLGVFLLIFGGLSIGLISSLVSPLHLSWNDLLGSCDWLKSSSKTD